MGAQCSRLPFRFRGKQAREIKEEQVKKQHSFVFGVAVGVGAYWAFKKYKGE